MNAVAILDAVSLAGFAVAFVAALFVPARRGGWMEPSAKFFMALALGVYVFVAFSNVLEHANMTSALDVLEDYLEVAFFPLAAYVAYSMDVSDRLHRMHLAQVELRHERDLTESVINTSPAAVVMVEGDTVRFASERVRTLFGLRQAPAPDGSDLWMRGYGYAGSSPRQSIVDIAAQAPFRDELFEIDSPHEQRVVSASAEVASGDEIAETVVALVDVTERVQSDAELAAYREDLEGQVAERTRELTRLNTELEVSNRAKREFLSKMSHELRTPLNSIIGFTGVMLRGLAGDVSDEQRNQLEMVERASGRLLALVNDVLDVSKIESGQATVALRPTQLHALVASLVGELRPLAVERGITFTYESESTTPEVRTDPDKIEQIARNLITTAIRLSPEHGTIAVVLRDAEDGVVLTVSDRGVGMTTEQRVQALDPFFQADAAMDSSEEATGLGLAIADELAGLIGARLEIASEPGDGSTFRLTVPA